MRQPEEPNPGWRIAAYVTLYRATLHLVLESS